MLNVGQGSADGVSYGSGNVAQNYTDPNLTNALNAERRASKICRYPLKRIESSSDYLMIKVVKYEPPGLSIGERTENVTTTTDPTTGETTSTSSFEGSDNINIGSVPANERLNLKKLKYLLYLPIPQYISDSTSVTWGEDRLDPLAAFGLAFGKDALQNPIQAVNKFMELGNAKLSEMIKDPGTRNAFISAVAGQAYGALGGNVTGESVLSRATGQVLNPNMELLFQGPNLRSFPFTFDMVARSKKEADEIKKIIKIFKRSMVARSNSNSSAKSGVFISAPDVFQLEYRKGNSAHPFLNKFQPMALSSFEVNYTGSNTYATYYDGSPVHLTLNLTFQELNPIYLEDYDKLDAAGDTSVGY